MSPLRSAGRDKIWERGALIAGLLFILPGVVAIMALGWVYAIWGNAGFVSMLFFGLKAAMLAIVLPAVLRVGNCALQSCTMQAIAAASLLGAEQGDLTGTKRAGAFRAGAAALVLWLLSVLALVAVF